MGRGPLRQHGSSAVLSILLTFPSALFSSAAECISDLEELGRAQSRAVEKATLKARIKQPDSGKQAAPERRIKQLTFEDIRMELADPTEPVMVSLPNGKSEWRIYGSGELYLAADSIDTFLKADHSKIRVGEIHLYHADGTRMKGPYHSGGLPWDKYEVGGVGYAGALVQPHLREGAPSDAPKEPTVMEGNFSRDRHAFEIRRKYGPDGNLVEEWHDLGSVEREHFDDYKRNQYLIPIKRSLRNGKPWIEVDEQTPQPAEQSNPPERQRKRKAA